MSAPDDSRHWLRNMLARMRGRVSRETARERRANAERTRPALPFRRISGRRRPDPLIIFDGNALWCMPTKPPSPPSAASCRAWRCRCRFRAPEMQALHRRASCRSRGRASSRLYRERAGRTGLQGQRVLRRHGTGLYVLVFKDQSEARRIDRMRADFIANASHELRTPLASIAGFIETLRGPARNDARRASNSSQIMQDQTARMARLIDDLLSLSRLEMKPYLTPGAEVDIAQGRGQRHRFAGAAGQRNGIAVERHFAERDPLVPGDRDELFQVFENLFENACKYGQPGGRVVVSIAEAP